MIKAARAQKGQSALFLRQKGEKNHYFVSLQGAKKTLWITDMLHVAMHRYISCVPCATHEDTDGDSIMRRGHQEVRLLTQLNMKCALFSGQSIGFRERQIKTRFY